MIALAILLVFLIAFSGCTSKTTGQVAETVDSTPEQLSEPPVEEKKSMEYMLATINAGEYVPEDDVTVYRFRYLLNSLEKKTKNSKQEIGDMSVAVVTKLKEKYGKEKKLLDFMEEMNDTIPDGLEMEYAEVLALYLTMVDS